MANEVADTILAQLGGKKFLVMTGAKQLLASEKSLQMKLPIGHCTCITVQLEADDTYTVYGYTGRGTAMTQNYCCEGVYADRLRVIFTEATGLETSL